MRDSIVNIVIILPFANADKETSIWAHEEAQIDFRQDVERAARCTLAFAATELRGYLARTLAEVHITFASQHPATGFWIELRVLDQTSKDEGFRLEPQPGGLVITGQGRTGTLYGAYEFLRLQGWRWYAPDKTGEIAPSPRETLVLPEATQSHAPSMRLARGFDFEGVSKESAELWLWMARNRLSLATFRPATGPLGKKLGMTLKLGGHIFEAILDPDRVLPSGKTLWEEHELWYGLPADGVRRKERALGTQFCVSQPNLLAFLGEELLRTVMGAWYEADLVDVWGFDTWGSTCQCAACQALGNSTDQTLFFISALRAYLDRARQEGRLDHDVRLSTCAYEGTATIAGPERPYPQNLLAAGDNVTFYPINRCYAHDFAEPACALNDVYAQALRSWFVHQPALPMMVGEYYNVSKFEDLPLLFTTRIAHDLPTYYAAGARGMTYMHTPLVNWGMRTLTQALYAQLAWGVHTDVDAFLDEYFAGWYGPYAQEMRQVYAWIEEAWLYSAEWRAWSKRSVLSQLRAWDGARPTQPLPMDNHFQSSAQAVASGRRSIALLEEALQALHAVRAHERRTAAEQAAPAQAHAVNPIDVSRQGQASPYELRLGEDRRLLTYGLDTLTIMTELTAYHDALYRGEHSEAEEAWQAVERAAEALDGYYIPIGFEWPGAGLESKDGLTRAQVRDLLRRCRKYRGETAP
jgi:hypothetical protein